MHLWPRYVQNEIATVLGLLYKHKNFVKLLADQARAVVMAMAFHAGGPGSIPVNPTVLFHLHLTKYPGVLLIW